MQDLDSSKGSLIAYSLFLQLQAQAMQSLCHVVHGSKAQHDLCLRQPFDEVLTLHRSCSTSIYLLFEKLEEWSVGLDEGLQTGEERQPSCLHIRFITCSPDRGGYSNAFMVFSAGVNEMV